MLTSAGGSAYRAVSTSRIRHLPQLPQGCKVAAEHPGRPVSALQGQPGVSAGWMSQGACLGESRRQLAVAASARADLPAPAAPACARRSRRSRRKRPAPLPRVAQVNFPLCWCLDMDRRLLTGRSCGTTLGLVYARPTPGWPRMERHRSSVLAFPALPSIFRPAHATGETARKSNGRRERRSCRTVFGQAPQAAAAGDHWAHAVNLPLCGAPPCRAMVQRLESVFQ